MGITLQLNDEQSRRLVEIAQDLKVEPSALAEAAIQDLLSRRADDFSSAAQRVLDKNHELYRRLS